MKVIFADDSMAKLKYLALSETGGSGFLKTERIGRYILIRDLINGNLNKVSGKTDLISIYEMWGSKFGGVFIQEEDEIFPEHFPGKLVLKLGRDKYSISFYDSGSGKDKLICEGSFVDN